MYPCRPEPQEGKRILCGEKVLSYWEEETILIFGGLISRTIRKSVCV
jgi:hypothetical protein